MEASQNDDGMVSKVNNGGINGRGVSSGDVKYTLPPVVAATLSHLVPHL
jgi:hypothetical protein